MTGIVVERHERVVTVTLDGGRGNALDTAGYVALREAAESVAPDQVLHLRARGRNFCAGQDLDEWRGHDDRRALLRTGCSGVLALLRCAGPVVVSAQGAAVGGGALLVAAADLAVLSDDVWMALPELQLGLPLGAAVAERLLPAATVRRMLLTGVRVDATTVAAAGAAHLVPRAELEDAAVGQVAQLLALDPAVLTTGRGHWGGGEREGAARAYERELDACLTHLAGA